MIETSKWDKTLEFFALLKSTHPFTAVRAYEVDEWVKTEDFQKAMEQYNK